MKNTLLILFLFINIKMAFSQVNGIVHYKIEEIKNVFDDNKIKRDDKKMRGNLSLINGSLNKYSDSFQFKLKFNKNESTFKFIEVMQINNNDLEYKMAHVLSGAGSIYYMNSKEDLKLTKKSAYGKGFIIKEHISEQKWKLYNTSKKIGNYTCYKATTSKVVENSRGTFNKLIEAWYTPEISVNFGPKGYGGLPGLIIELNESFIKYYATKIELNPKKKIKIRKPNIGKLISKNELMDIGKALQR